MNYEEYSIPSGAKATLVSICNPNMDGHTSLEESQVSLNELKELITTLGLNPGQEFIQNKPKIEAATVLGKGKLTDIGEEAKKNKSDILVFDFDLTASQVRNIQKITQLEVVDRCSIILEIFAKHAKTKEAKIQIEISRLEYLLPRLSKLWAHLGRQRGGIGVRGGEGEQQIELDRRIIRKKIESYKRQMGEIATSRIEQRKRRQDKVVKAALVGYTNAGKSSLMNRLCRVNVLEENKLFATLDSTFRTLNPDSKPPMLLIDTVGFIRNLPASLISGFRTTLESALEADLLLLVCDISDPNYQSHLDVTLTTLDELGTRDKDLIIIFNKRDQLDSPLAAKLAMAKFENSKLVCANDEEDMTELRQFIIDYFLSKQKVFDLFVPYQDGGSHARINGNANIIKTKSHKDGIFYRIRIPENIFHTLKIGQHLLGPTNPHFEHWQKVVEGNLS